MTGRYKPPPPPRPPDDPGWVPDDPTVDIPPISLEGEGGPWPVILAGLFILCIVILCLSGVAWGVVSIWREIL